MTTIRDELSSAVWADARAPIDTICEALGIDPDLPKEWATEKRCLTWLREAKQTPLTIDVPPDGASTLWIKDRPHYGASLHAALIAACQAVQPKEEA